MRGSESLAIINQYFATAGEEVKAVHRQLEELNQRRADVNRQASEAYSELAQFLLCRRPASSKANASNLPLQPDLRHTAGRHSGRLCTTLGHPRNRDQPHRHSPGSRTIPMVRRHKDLRS